MSHYPQCVNCGAASYDGSTPHDECRCPFCGKAKFKQETDPPPPDGPTLRHDIEEAINRHSAENGSDTPDFILAQFLVECLRAFDEATRARTKWYKR